MEKAKKILIAITLLSIPAYLVRFSILGISTNVLEILVFACFGLAVFDKTNRTDRTDKTDRTYATAIVLIFVGLLVSTLVNENYRTGFGIIKGWFIVPLIFGWVLIRERKEKEREERLKSVLRWLYWSIFSIAVISLVYYFSGNFTYDGRLKAFYLSPNHLAMYLSPGIIIGFYFIKEIISQSNRKASLFKLWQMMSLLAYASRRYKLFFLIISLFIISFSLYLTYSYATWLAVILSMIITYLIAKKKVNKRAILISLIILLTIVVSQWNTAKMENLKNFSRSSLESRIMIWKSAGKILSDNPIWGIGPGNFQNKYLEYQKYFPPYLEWAVPQPHNLYLAFWLNAGISGLAGFLILIFNWLKNLSNFIKKQKSGTIQIAAAILGIMLYVLIHGLADTSYWKNDLALVFWITFSLGVITQKLNIDSV